VIYEEKHSTRLAHNPDMKKFSYLSCEVALMSIQARCILAFGHVAGDPVLDVNHLLQCFFDDVPFSPEDVLKKYGGERKELTPKERRELMRIRKKLQILRLLEKEQMLPSQQELLAWFAVWDQTHF